MIFNLPSEAQSLFNVFWGDANRQAMEALADSSEKLLYLWGAGGLGKSYLLEKWIEVARQNNQRTRLIYPEENLDGFDETPYDFIALIDIHKYLPAQQASLFTLFNYWRENNVSLLFSATVAPLSLPFREDIRTRLGLSLVYEIKPITDEEKIKILQNLAHSRQMYVHDDVYRYLLRHAHRDLDLLIYIITRLDDYALTHGKKMTLSLLKSYLEEEKYG